MSTADPGRSRGGAGTDAERLRRVQEALEVAAITAEAGISASAEEQRVLQRIAQQRRRLEGGRPALRGDAKYPASASRLAAAALAPGGVDGMASGQGGAAAPVGRTLAEAAAANPLYVAGRDFVLRHPLAVGFTLGSLLVLGPRRLARAVVWAAPLVWRGWRMVERTGVVARALRR